MLLLLLTQALLDLYLPTLNREIINNGIMPNPVTGQSNVPYIWRTGGFMLLTATVSMACAIAASWFASRTAMAAGRDIRTRLFAHVQSFSRQEMDRFGTPSLITRTTNDVQQVQIAVMMMLRMMVTAPLMAVGGVVMALRQDVTLSSIIAVIVPVMALFVALLASRFLPMMGLQQKKLDRLTQVMREKLSGVRVIRAFVREDYEEARFDTANREHADVNLKIGRLMAYMMPAMTILFNTSMAAVLWFGAHRIDAGLMDMGRLMAFLTYLMQILMSVMIAVMMFILLPRAAASAGRINEVLGLAPSIREPEPGAARDLGNFGQAPALIRFDHVSFRYPGAEADVLTDICFDAAPGQVVAVVGSTGSGKSTLVNLIPRFFDVTEGAVLLGGTDIRSLPLHTLRAQIGFIPQKAFLFTGTVASNLRCGREEADDEALWEALAIAQARDFVAAMPNGLVAPIEQGGANVSGGQRQRLAIARALVKQPALYVFDDSFSALDLKTDAALRAALRRSLSNAVIFIVAQRISTIQRADLILVLDEGRMAGRGTHEELLRTCEVYREIARSQLPKGGRPA